MTPCRRAHVHAGLVYGQVLLQRLGAESVQLLPSPQLSLFASGLDSDVSGLVLQVGYSDTTALPICHSMPLVQSASIAKLGSKTLHACLYQLALQVGAHNLILIYVLSACNRRLRTKVVLHADPAIEQGKEVIWTYTDRRHVPADDDISSPAHAPAAPDEANRSIEKLKELTVDDLGDCFDHLLLQTCQEDAALPASHYRGTSDEDSKRPAPTDDTFICVHVGSQWQVKMSSEVRRDLLGVLFGGSCASFVTAAGPSAVDTESSVGVLVLEALLRCPIDVRARVAAKVPLPLASTPSRRAVASALFLLAR